MADKLLSLDDIRGVRQTAPPQAPEPISLDEIKSVREDDADNYGLDKVKAVKDLQDFKQFHGTVRALEALSQSVQAGAEANRQPGRPVPTAEIAAGLGETAINFASFFLAADVGLGAGALEAIKKGDIGAFPPVFESVTHALTYRPGTESGRQIVGAVGDAMNKLLVEWPKAVGEKFREWGWGDEMALAAEIGIPSVVLLSPYAIGLPAYLSRKSGGKPGTPPKSFGGDPPRVEPTIEGEVPTLTKVIEMETGKKMPLAEKSVLDAIEARKPAPRAEISHEIIAQQLRDAVEGETNIRPKIEITSKEVEAARAEVAKADARVKLAEKGVAEAERRLKQIPVEVERRAAKPKEEAAPQITPKIAEDKARAKRQSEYQKIIDSPIPRDAKIKQLIKKMGEQRKLSKNERLKLEQKLKASKEVKGGEAKGGKVLIKDLTPVQKYDFREPFHREKVEAAKKEIQAGKAKPIRIEEGDKGELLVTDGVHRLQAYKELKKRSIPADAIRRDKTLKKDTSIPIPDFDKIAEEAKVVELKAKKPETKAPAGKIKPEVLDVDTYENMIDILVGDQGLTRQKAVKVLKDAGITVKRGKTHATKKQMVKRKAPPRPPTQTEPVVATPNLSSPISAERRRLTNAGVLPEKASFEEVQSTLFRVDKAILPSKRHGGNPRLQRVIVRRTNDIHPLRRDISSRLAPSKFVADLHPLLKWGIDTMEAAVRRVEVLTEQLLYAPEFVKKSILSGLTARRAVTPQATTRGGLTAYDKLPVAKQAKIAEDGFIWKHAEIEPTREMMEARGWTEDMISAYGTIRQMLNKTADIIDNRLQSIGKTAPMRRDPGFLPGIFTGDFRVFVNDARGQLIDAFPFDSRRAAERVAEKMRKELPNATINVRAILRKKGGEVNSFREVINALGRKSPEAKAVRKAFLDIVKEKRTEAFFKDRAVGGYLGSEGGSLGAKNFRRALEIYVEGAVRYAEMAKMTHEISRALINPRIGKHYPNAQRVLQNMYDVTMGKQNKVDAVLNSWAVEVFGKGESFVTRKVNFVNQLTLFAKLFAFQGRFLIANGLQPYLVTPSKLVNLKGLHGIRGSVIEAEALAAKNFWFPSPEARAALESAFLWKTVDPKFIREASGGELAFSKDPFGIPKHAIDVATGRRIAGRVEEYSRMNSFLQFYYFLRSAGVDIRMAQEGARYLTDKYMVEYTANTRPLIFNELGAVGKSVGIFQTFNHNILAQQVEHIKAAGKGAPAGLATFVASQVFMAGLTGLIGIEAADQLLHALGYPTLTQKILELGYSDSITWGAPSAALDLDLTTTTAGPGLGLKDLVHFGGWEYVGKSVYDGVNWGVKKAMGKATPADALKFWSSVAPTSMKGLIEKHYAKDGLVMTAKRGGVATVKRDAHDWLARYMSGRSLKEARILKAMWQVTLVKQNRAYDIDSLADQAAWAVMNNDGDIPDWIWDAAFDDFDVKPRDFWRRVQNRVDNMSTDMIEQATNLERTAEGRRVADQLRAMGVDPDTVFEEKGTGP